MKTPLKFFTIHIGLLVGLMTVTLVAQSQAASNDSLGRLFSRPNERNNLDYLRQSQKLKAINPQPEEEKLEVAPTELPEPITLQGYVKRSDGKKSTLWINNQAVQEGGTLNSIQIGRLNRRGSSSKGGDADSVDIKIPASGKHVRLKAGQVYEPDTNQIKELKTVEKERWLNLEEAGVVDGSDEKSQH